MSYSKSPAPMPAEAMDALREALVQVCEKSFFAYVEPCEPARFAELVEQLAAGAQPGSSEWLKASVTFTGGFGGAIEIVLPERLARWMVASLIGTSQNTELQQLEVELQQVELSEHQLFDGIGEFANMVCGAWLTDLSRTRAFELRPPAVTRMSPEWSPAADSHSHEDGGHRLCVNDLPVRVRSRLATN